MTIAQDNAERFATRDRDHAADQILEHAVREVIAAYRVGRRLERMRLPGTDGVPAAAAFALCKAARSAERVLGA